ncbi:MAG: hypothetical protein GEV11_21660 [Streptosporangiales bacterium]|nr:hypothetical protein [Streptosporangiales bacterium]
MPESPAMSAEPGEPAGPGRDGQVLELRIHGVNGTPAADILGSHPTHRTAGDDLAGFYRRGSRADPVDPRVTREAYAWGNMTSGGATRALWLLLLPFSLANLALWMRPRLTRHGDSAPIRLVGRVYDAAARFIALGLTATLILATAGMSMDLAAWQCAGEGRECGASTGWLRFMTTDGAWWEQPGRRLVVAVLVPLALVGLLWFLSRRTWRQYESLPASGGTPEDTPLPLAHGGFWDGRRLVGRLRALHIAIAIGMLALQLTLPTYEADAATGGPAGFGSALLAVLTAAMVLAGLAAALERSRPGPAATTALRVAAHGARNVVIAAGVVAIGYAALSRPEWESTGQLPGLSRLINWLLGAEAVALLVLILAALVLRVSSRSAAPVAMFGLVGPITAAFGLFLGAAFSASITYRAADWLDCAPPPGRLLGSSGCGALSPPQVYAWAQLGFSAETLAAVVAALVVGACFLIRRGRARAEVRRRYPEADGGPEVRTHHIAATHASASLTELLPYVMGLLVVTPIVFGALAIGFAPEETAAPATAIAAGLADEAGGVVRGGVGFLVSLGSWLIGAFLVGLVALGRAAYSSHRTRRIVGILWDLATFWPRSAHPLAPPCYAERTVPQLTTRVAHWVEDHPGVIISGHSQGSVLAAAVVWQLPSRARERVHLLTHGSPLGRLYAKYFPAYFGPAQFSDLGSRVRGWTNLWRLTDPIGGAVTLPAGRVQPRAEPLTDPASYGCPPGEVTFPKIQGHGDYTDDPVYLELVNAAAADLAGSGRVSATGEVVLPRPRSTPLPPDSS